jgi:hypothetical protein
MMRRSEMPPVPPQPWAQLRPPDSFYARLAEWRDVLVDDEERASGAGRSRVQESRERARLPMSSARPC